jgi:hypothetical protein
VLLIGEYSNWVGTDDFEHHVCVIAAATDELEDLWSMIGGMTSVKDVNVNAIKSTVFKGCTAYEVNVCFTRPEDVLIFRMRWFLE